MVVVRRLTGIVKLAGQTRLKTTFAGCGRVFSRHWHFFGSGHCYNVVSNGRAAPPVHRYFFKPLKTSSLKSNLPCLKTGRACP
jgi:hypothetical protein